MPRVSLLVLAAANPLSGQQPEGQSRPPVVAVLDFTNSSLVDHDMYEPFTVGLATILITELRRNPDVELVERERLREVLNEIQLAETGRVDRESAVEAGKILGAHYVVTGGFIIDRRGNLQIDARAISVETTRIEHVETVTDNADDLLRAVHRLGRQLSTSLHLPARGPQTPDPGPAPSGQVLANLKYARALLEEDRKHPDRAIQLYRQFLADSPVDYAVVLRREAQDRIRTLTGGRHD